MQNTHLNWKQFLNRPEISFDGDAIQRAFKGSRVLITGAGGCIGSALAKQCAKLPIESVALLDSSEKSIYDLDRDLIEIGSELPRTCIVGDICDQALLEETFAVSRPDVVFHAAACKHVPLMEKNPFTAARTNAVGTQRVAATAARHRVEQFILLSTDKAVEPTSIMGATKRIAELIVLANTSRTQMKAVRLGNVLGSSGSVVPLFLNQIANGGPVTVTHPDATRYFITLDESVSLLLSAVLDPQNAVLLITEPGEPRRIEELARFVIAKSSSEISIAFTELRPGDKLHEHMTSGREVTKSPRGILQTVRSPAATENALRQTLQKITKSIHERDLEVLLQTICSIVPEYNPGAWLQSQGETLRREFR
jgi:FlaA1/EpsC-like NDP-sugar epimerase